MNPLYINGGEDLTFLVKRVDWKATPTISGRAMVFRLGGVHGCRCKNQILLFEIEGDYTRSVLISHRPLQKWIGMIGVRSAICMSA